MKTKRQLTAIAIVLLSAGLNGFGIENLKIAVQCPDVVLSWPSQVGETYIVQYRPTLNTNTPWMSLTNSLPAATGTNWTSFIHATVIADCPPPEAAAGGGAQAASSWVTMSEEDRAARREELREQAEATAEYLMAMLREAIAKAQADREQWAREGRPTSQAAASFEGNSPEGGESQSVTNTGFYRVVRNGIFFFGVTNGTILSGRVTLPVEVGLTTGQTLDSLYANAGNNPAESVGVQGLEFAGLEDGLPHAVWDTTQVPNGVHQINLGAVVGEGVDVPGSTISMAVSNQIWFPHPYNWAGYFIEVQAAAKFSRSSAPTLLSWSFARVV